MLSSITLLLLLPLAFALPSPSEEASSILPRTDYYHGTCETCKPFPGENRCDITTSCTVIWGHNTAVSPAPLYCACRAGYRADNVAAGDSSAQWRFDWPSQEGRVFVRPGLSCNTLCDDWQLGKDGCQAVKIRQECF